MTRHGSLRLAPEKIEEIRERTNEDFSTWGQNAQGGAKLPQHVEDRQKLLDHAKATDIILARLLAGKEPEEELAFEDLRRISEVVNERVSEIIKEAR